MKAFATKEVGVGAVRKQVVLPIANTPDLSSLIAVPSIVAAGPPGDMTVPAIEKPEGFGVKVWPATVYTLLRKMSDGLGREIVLLPIARTPD